MNVLKVLRIAAKKAEAKQEAATRELLAITAAIGALDGHGRKPGPRRGRRSGWKMSAAARRKISIAQKARWARAK